MTKNIGSTHLTKLAFISFLLAVQLISGNVAGHGQDGSGEGLRAIPKTACRISGVRCSLEPCEVSRGPEGRVLVGLFGREVTLWAIWLDLRDPGGKPRPMPGHPEIPLEFDLTLFLWNVQKGWQIASLRVEPAAGSGVRIRGYDFGRGPLQFPERRTVPWTLIGDGRVNIYANRVGEVRVEMTLRSVGGQKQRLEFEVQPIFR